MRGLIFFLTLLSPSIALGDVIRPAVIEINVEQSGQIDIEVRTSIEAVMTGMGGKYKNTIDAPNADEYDALRNLKNTELTTRFNSFIPTYEQKINATDQREQRITLTVTNTKIPPVGYPKVPRISSVYLTGMLPAGATALTFDYPVDFSEFAVRLQQKNIATNQFHWSDWQWIRGDKKIQPFSLTEVITPKSTWQYFIEYLNLGFKHILPNGFDHLLFVLGIFLFSPRWRALLWQITAFTLAHTITLGLSAMNIIKLSPQIVEPLIALSIAYVAFENLFYKSTEQTRIWLLRRSIIVFGFGLLHGLAFADFLAEFGMPTGSFFAALIGFNIGVEFGQIAAILIAYTLFAWQFKDADWYRAGFVMPASMFIGFLGLYWLLERLLFI